MSALLNMSPSQKMEYGNLYRSDPETVKKLTTYPEPIGRIAKLCVECGVGT